MKRVFKSAAEKRLIAGSTVPIANLIDYIKDGYSMFDFLDAYPWLKMNAVKKALDDIKDKEYFTAYA